MAVEILILFAMMAPALMIFTGAMGKLTAPMDPMKQGLVGN